MVTNRIKEHFRDADHSSATEILIVEDDREVAESLARQAVEYFDKPVVLAGSLAEAEAYLDQSTPSIALVDMLLPDGDGTELLLRLERENVGAVAVMTAAPSMYRATVALRTGAADFLVKPFTSRDVAGMFERLARRLADRTGVVRLREEVDRVKAHNDHLRMKIDILCKDLVGGYQKLVTRLAAPGK